MASPENLGPLGEMLHTGFFADLRFYSWLFYEYNMTPVVFLWLNSIAYANADFVKEVCPPAFIQIQLIRAEERLPMMEQSLALIEIARMPLPPAEIMHLWPIQQGLDRIEGLIKKVTMKAHRASVGLVMPFSCDADEGGFSDLLGDANSHKWDLLSELCG